METKYKVWVIADRSGHWSTNAKEFNTEQEADDWGFDLSFRWTAVREYKVCAIGDDPNKERIPAGLTTADALQRCRG